MYTRLTKSDFTRTFLNASESSSYNDAFSREGANSLYDYLEENHESMEFDPVGLSCAFDEYENISEYNSDFGTDYESWSDLHDITIEFGEDSAIVLVEPSTLNELL